MAKIDIINMDDFARTRKENGYYVDKTGFIEEFLQNPADGPKFRVPADAILFTRPRRFGKTLFMSMLAEFFDITKDSRELFEGLAVSSNKDLCDQWMNQYPVIFLSLKDVDKPTYKEALKKIRSLVSDVCLAHNYLLKSSMLDDEERKKLKELRSEKADDNILADALLILSRALRYHYDKPAIVLIDEYDAPIAKAADNGYYDEMVDFMRNFLSACLKSNRKNMKLGILTGCLQIAQRSIFSGLNHFKSYDISDYEYMDVFGLTQDDVDTILLKAGLWDRREELKEWYDGYCFGEHQEMYCPWSILNRVYALQKNPRVPPKAYWNKTSENTVIKRLFPGKYLEMADDIAKLVSGGVLVTQVNLEPTYDSLDSSAENLWSLLYLSGYLTTASEEQTQKSGISPNPNRDEMALVIPNMEIHKIFEKEVQRWFDGAVSKKQTTALLEAFWKTDTERFKKEIEAILLKNVSSKDLAKEPASSAKSSDESPRENFYHGLLVGYFLVAYPDTLSNMEVGEGFYDIQVLDNNTGRAAIVEVKRCADEKEDLLGLAEKGLKQIEKNKYNVRLLSDPSVKKLIHWSIAFCKKSCEARAIIVRQP